MTEQWQCSTIFEGRTSCVDLRNTCQVGGCAETSLGKLLDSCLIQLASIQR